MRTTKNEMRGKSEFYKKSVAFHEESISSQPYGRLADGRAVDVWQLRGAGGLVLEVITYGGIVTRLLVPDSMGNSADVVLGYDRLDPYLLRHPYFGAITGRVAGRITGSRFTLDGCDYPLTANDGSNHLHGGLVGLDRRLWVASPIARPDQAPSLRLTYRSPHGEENYPGNVEFTVTYTVTADNAFVIETEAITDRPTPVSLTHHSYFNLNGEGNGDVRDHALQIHADTCFPASSDFTLLDSEEPVAGGPDDLNQARRVGDAQPGFHLGHGSLYRVRRPVSAAVGSGLVPVARLTHPGSGRVLQVSSTERLVQLYSGAMLPTDGPPGKSGRPYGPLAGICLECEDYPNGVAAPWIGDIIVHPGNPYRHKTVYAFSTQSK